MPGKILEGALRQLQQLESLLLNPTQAVVILADETEKLVEKKLKRSPDDRDRKAAVEVQRRAFGIDINIKRPEKAERQGKLDPKKLQPGRYYEIHGPGGKTKITTSLSVMEKARKQGIHVQMKYRMPDGREESGFSVYGADKPLARIEPLQKNEIIDRLSPEFREVLTKIDVYFRMQAEAISGRAV